MMPYRPIFSFPTEPRRLLFWLAVLVSGLLAAGDAKQPDSPTPSKAVIANSAASSAGDIPEPKQQGGEPDGVVQVANLVYAGTKSSKCFSDHFLIEAEKVSSISTSRRFHAVKLASQELFEFPLVIMTGEGAFDLPDIERQNLRKFIENGGLLLASAGCHRRIGTDRFAPRWRRFSPIIRSRR